MANIDTAIRLSGDREFKASIREIQNQLGNLRTGMRATSEEFRNNADSVEALKAKQENLSGQIRLHENILETARQYLERYRSEQGENATATVKMANTVNLARESLYSLRNELSAVNAKLDESKTKESAFVLGTVNANDTLAGLQKTLKSYESQLDAINKEQSKGFPTAEQARQRQEALRDAYKQSQAVVAELQRQLDYLRVVIDENSDEFIDLQVRLNEARGKMREFEASIQTTYERLQHLGGQIQDVGGDMTKYLTAPILGIGTAVTKFGIDFESAFAGVQQSVDETADGYNRLRQGILDMNVPVAPETVAGVVEIGGRLGIANENLLTFTQTLLDTTEVTKMSVEQAATEMARFANIIKMPQSEFDRLGSTIIELDKSAATSASEIISMGTRIAAAGDLAEMTASEITALAATLSSLGLEAQAGGSAISKVIRQMVTAIKSGGDDVSKFASITGMAISEFKSLFERDASNAVAKFVEGLGRIKDSGGDLTATLKELSISEVNTVDTLSRLAGSGSMLADLLDTANTAWAENTALVEAAEKRYATTASQLKALWEEVKKLGIEFSDVIIPVVKDVISALRQLISGFAEMNDGTKEAIVKIGLFAAAIGPVVSAIGSLITVIGTVQGAIAVMGGGMVAATPAVAGLATTMTTLSKVLATVNPVCAAVVVGLGLVAAAVKHVSDADERAVKKSAELLDSYKQLTVEFNANKATIEELKDRYAELAQGVDKFGNNVGLSAEKYAEYNELQNKIANIFPEMVLGYNDEGNAVLSLSGNVSELTAELDRLILKQQESANLKILDGSDDVFKGIQARIKGYQNEISLLENGVYSLQRAAEELKINNSTMFYSDTAELETFKRMLDAVGVSYREIINPGTWQTEILLEGNVNLDKLFEGIDKEFEFREQQVSKQIEALKGKIETAFIEYNPIVTAYLETNLIYTGFDEDIQEIARKLAAGLDFNELNLNTAEEVENYIENNILTPLSQIEPQAKEIFAKIFDLRQQLEEGEIGVTEFTEQVQKQLSHMFDGLDSKTQKEFLFLLDKAGVSGKDLASVLNALAASLSGVSSSIAGANEAQSNAVSTNEMWTDQLYKHIQALSESSDELHGLQKASNDLESAYDSLSQGQQLSNDILLRLIDNYPELARHIANNTDLTFQDGQVIRQVNEESRRAAIQRVQDELDKTTATIEGTQRRIEAIQWEIRALSLLSVTLKGTTGGFSDRINELSTEESAMLEGLEAAQEAADKAAARLVVLQNQSVKAVSLSSARSSSAKQAAKEEDNAYKEAIKNLESRLEMEQLTVQETIAGYQKIRDELTKTDEEKFEVNKKITALAIEDLENRIELEGMSVEDIVNGYERIRDEYAKTEKEKLDINKKITSSLIKNLENVAELEDKNNLELIEGYKEIRDEFAKSENERLALTKKITSLQKEEIKKYGDAATEALKKGFEQQKNEAVDFLKSFKDTEKEKRQLFKESEDEQVQFLRDASEKKIDIVSEEFIRRIEGIDAVTAAQLRSSNEIIEKEIERISLFDESLGKELRQKYENIAALEKEIEAEKRLAQEKREQEKLEKLRDKVAAAETYEDWMAAQKELDDYLAERALKRKEEDLKARQEELKALEEKGRREIEQIEKTIAAEQEAQEKILNDFEKLIDTKMIPDVERFYKYLQDKAPIFAAQLFIQGDTDKLDKLIDEFNPDWQMAGKGFFDFLTELQKEGVGLDEAVSFNTDKITENYEVVNKLVSQQRETVTGEVLGMTDDIHKVLEQMAYDAYDSGRNTGEGLLQGLDSMIPAVIGKATELGAAIKTGISTELEESSPSRATRRSGINAGKGLALGLTDTMAEVRLAAGKLVKSAVLNGIEIKNAVGQQYVPGNSSHSETSNTYHDTGGNVYLTIERFENTAGTDMQAFSENLAFISKQVRNGKGRRIK